MSIADDHLAQYDVSLQAANDFILSNLDNPGHIFDVCKEFGVTNYMLSLITGYDESVVRDFWQSQGKNPDDLTSPGSTIVGTENQSTIVGTYGDDNLTGSSSDDWFEPGLGNDSITSTNRGAITYYDHSSGITADLSKGTVVGLGKSDTFSASTIYRIQGSAFDDVFIGRTDDAFSYGIFDGMAGNDQMTGSSEHDELAYHLETGGNAITVNFQTGTATDSYGDTDSFSAMEAVRATKYDDLLVGANKTSEDDQSTYTLFRSLAGNDTIQGGTGYDIASYDRDSDYQDQQGNYGSAGINANLMTGTIIDGYGHSDSVSSIEEVRGTDSDDVIIGTDRTGIKEEFRGNGGNDTLTGNGGLDHFRFSLSNDEGRDTITDFTVGEDLIEMVGVSDFASEVSINSFGNQTIVSYGEGNQIILNGVASLSESDFVFG